MDTKEPLSKILVAIKEHIKRLEQNGTKNLFKAELSDRKMPLKEKVMEQVILHGSATIHVREVA